MASHSLPHVPLVQIAILEYLEEAKGGQALLPSDPITRAKVRELVQIVASGTQPVQNLRVLRKHGLEHKVTP
jgi:glutathione S-transferase